MKQNAYVCARATDAIIDVLDKKDIEIKSFDSIKFVDESNQQPDVLMQITVLLPTQEIARILDERNSD